MNKKTGSTRSRFFLLLFRPDRQFERDAFKVTLIGQVSAAIVQVHHGGEQLQRGRFERHLSLRLDRRQFAFGLQPGAVSSAPISSSCRIGTMVASAPVSTKAGNDSVDRSVSDE